MTRILVLLAALLGLLAGPARAAIGTPVSLGTVADATAFTTRTLSTLTVPAGALILVVLMDSEGSCCLPVSVADSAGNTYTALTTVPNSSTNLQTKAFYTCNAAALSSGTITGTFATSDPVLKTMHASYTTGIATASCADNQPTPTAATSTSPSITTGALAQADEIVFGYVGVESGSSVVFTEGAGFTQVSQTAPSDLLNVAYDIVAATTAVTYAPSMDGSRHWGAGAITFKGAAAGAATPTMTLLGVGR